MVLTRPSHNRPVICLSDVITICAVRADGGIPHHIINLSILELCTRQVSPREIRASEVSLPQLCAREIRIPKINISQTCCEVRLGIRCPREDTDSTDGLDKPLGWKRADDAKAGSWRRGHAEVSPGHVEGSSPRGAYPAACVGPWHSGRLVPAHEDPLKPANDLIRAAAKCLIGSLGAIGALLIAGSQLSSIGSLESSDYRLRWAVAGLGISLAAILLAIWRVTALLVPTPVGIEDLANKWTEAGPDTNGVSLWKRWRYPAVHYLATHRQYLGGDQN